MYIEVKVKYKTSNKVIDLHVMQMKCIWFQAYFNYWQTKLCSEFLLSVVSILILIAKMMSGTNSLSNKCGACRRWVTNGLSCTECGFCFHINCASASHRVADGSRPWYWEPCKHQSHSKKQDERIRHLEQELEAAREEICKLKAGNISNSFLERDIFGHWKKPKNSKSRCRRFSANDVCKIKQNNKIGVLATDTLEVAQQTPVLLKHGSRERKSFTEKNRSKRKKKSS